MVRLGNPLQDLAWWIASDRALTSALQIDRLEGLGRVGQLMKELGVIPEESDFDVQNPGSIELRSTFERL